MKNLFFSFFLITIASVTWNSCSDSLCEQTVSYTRAVGEYAHLASLRVDDINVPTRPLTQPSKIFLSDNLILISELDHGIHVIDNTNPESPSFINFLSIPGNREMAVEGNMLYADAYYDMLSIDISNPRAAFIVDRLEEAFPVQHFDHDGNALINFKRTAVTETLDCDENIFNDETIFIDYRGARIPESAVDVSFTRSGDHIGTVNRFAISNDHLFALGFFNMYGFSLSDGMQQLSGVQYSDFGMETIFPFNDRLYIGSQNSMQILDASDPESLELIGSFWHATSCDPVLPVTNSVAYVTLRGGEECPGEENTLNVVAHNGHFSYSAIQTIELPSPYAMLRLENELYVGEGENGFRVFEIGSDWRLSEKMHNASITAFDIIPHPNRSDIILFAGPDGIFQYSVEPDEEYNLISSITY